MQSNQKIGLIAGSGKFPFMFAKAAKEKGLDVVAVAIKGNTHWCLKRFTDRIEWFKISEFGKMLDFLKQEEIHSVIMAGQIKPRTLFHRDIFRDEELRSLIVGLEDRRADSVLGAIANKISGAGINLLDSTIFLKDYLSPKGVLTKEQPSQEIWDDINFGFQMAKEISRLDIGQVVAVKNKAVVAVESLEGTDATILRAGRIASRGCVVVKVSKPDQDMRFDIPVVGLRTIKNLVKIKARCLALEAHKTLFIDKERCIAKAQRNHLIVVAV
jgi:DUF1009 family protein